jgi:hypothetical protein
MPTLTNRNKMGKLFRGRCYTLFRCAERTLQVVERTLRLGEIQLRLGEIQLDVVAVDCQRERRGGWQGGSR